MGEHAKMALKMFREWKKNPPKQRVVPERPTTGSGETQPPEAIKAPSEPLIHK
jgi:hypothetical protein